MYTHLSEVDNVTYWPRRPGVYRERLHHSCSYVTIPQDQFTKHTGTLLGRNMYQ